MKLIKISFVLFLCFFVLNVYSNKEDVEYALSQIKHDYTYDDSNLVRARYSNIYKAQDRFFSEAKKNYLFILDELRRNVNFNERTARNIAFLSYDPVTNSNSNETLVFVYHISCLLNKGIVPILNAFNEIDIQNSTELAICLFNLWNVQLKEALNIKLKHYDLCEQYDHFIFNLLNQIIRMKEENALEENGAFIRNNTNLILGYHRAFFNNPVVNFDVAINSLQRNAFGDNDIQEAIAVFYLMSDGIVAEGYDSATNTNIKETFVYLWQLCLLNNDINPILNALREIRKNINLTNAAIILSNEWVTLLSVHSHNKTIDPFIRNQEVVNQFVDYAPILMPISIKNADGADRIEYGFVNGVMAPREVLPNDDQEFIIGQDGIVPGHYYINFFRGNERKTNFLYVFQGAEPSAIQIQREDMGGWVILDTTGNFAGKKIICASEVGNRYQVIEGVGHYDHLMACDFLDYYAEDMKIVVSMPLEGNLEAVTEIPFFPNEQRVVNTFVREVQEVVQAALPIVNPMIIQKNYDDSDCLEYGKVGQQSKELRLNDAHEFVLDLDRLTPGHYFLRFYQGEVLQKTDYLYVFPGIQSSAIQTHVYPDGTTSYALTGYCVDKTFSCVSEMARHNDNGRVWQNILVFDHTFNINGMDDLKIIVSIPALEGHERIIEIPVFPTPENRVNDCVRPVLVPVMVAPHPAPVVAPVIRPEPIIIEPLHNDPAPIAVVPVRNGPVLNAHDQGRVEVIARELNQNAGRWEAAEAIMRKAPVCKRNYAEFQRIQQTIVRNRDIPQFNNYDEMLQYFGLRGRDYQRICEKSFNEHPQILARQISYPLSHPEGVTDYDYMISVASLLRHCETQRLLSDDDVGLLKLIFTGYFDDQIGRCSTGLFVRIFLAHMEILKKFYAN